MDRGASTRADEEGRKIFLGGLSFNTRDSDLREDFGKYGELEDVQLPMGYDGKHKGFAFITYTKSEDAGFACKEHHQRTYMDREISCKIVVPRAERDGGDRGGSRRGYGPPLPPLNPELTEKLEEWVQAKRRRDFATADALRSEMQAAGVNPEELRPKPGFGGKGDGSKGGGYGDRYDDRRGGYDDRRGGGDRYDDRGRSDRYDVRREDRYDDRRRSYSPDRRRRD